MEFELLVLTWLTDAASLVLAATGDVQVMLEKLVHCCAEAQVMWPGDSALVSIRAQAEKKLSFACRDSTVNSIKVAISACAEHTVDESYVEKLMAVADAHRDKKYDTVKFAHDDVCATQVHNIVANAMDLVAKRTCVVADGLKVVQFLIRFLEPGYPAELSYNDWVLLSKASVVFADGIAAYNKCKVLETDVIALDPEFTLVKTLLGQYAAVLKSLKDVEARDWRVPKPFEDLAKVAGQVMETISAGVKESVQGPMNEMLLEFEPIAGGGTEIGKYWHDPLHPTTATLVDVHDLAIQAGGLYSLQDFTKPCDKLIEMIKHSRFVLGVFGAEDDEACKKAQAVLDLMETTRAEQMLAVFSPAGLDKFTKDQRESKVKGIRKRMGGAAAFSRGFPCLYKRGTEAMKGR